MTRKVLKKKKGKKDLDWPSPPKTPKGLKLSYFEPDFEFYKSLLTGDVENKKFRQKANELKSDLRNLLLLMQQRYDVERNMNELEETLKNLDKDIELAHDILINKYT
jgi:hypothetical protein